MRTFRELFISSRAMPEAQVYGSLRRFALASAKWFFIHAKSCEYTLYTRNLSCILNYVHGRGKAYSLAFTAEQGVFRLVNVIRYGKPRIDIDEYNIVASIFSSQYKRFILAGGLPVEVSLSKPELDLKDIVPGRKARELFEDYLAHAPLSGLAADVRRLDLFICFLGRHARRPVATSHIKHYLVRKLRWSEEAAEWCRMRIETGLAVLRVNRELRD
ncbi:MAG: hypothetical protein AB1916_06980 [Thermodesulfobacteriota bacterium]